MELLPFVDILKVFNNPISEEQAWAVCYQCAQFLYRNPTQEFYQDVYDSGIHSIWISRHGDVLLRKGKGLQEPNGSGKGPPHSPQKQNSFERRLSNTSNIVPCRTKTGVIATETDAVQSLGMAIFETLDYGIDPTEERQLSAGLESLIASMTQTDDSSSCLMMSGADEDHEEYYDAASQNLADDEGIEKDADVEHRCTVEDVLKICRQHLSSKQDSQHHFKAVCRALATEAGELFTFLDKISSGREKLTESADDDTKRLEELQRADWACLWVQVMRSLRQGVLLKKIEHVHQPPLEYELTPFEMILEDIRSRRYTLHKIMVNGKIPHKVKNDAHEVILNFIRSRPPLKRVDERKLKPKPPPSPDPHELLLQDIRAKPKLRPIRQGKLVVETSRTHLNQDDAPDSLVPVKRIIKPDLNLLLNNSFDDSSEEDDTLDMSTPSLSSSCSSTPSPQKASHASESISWRRAAVKDSFSQDVNVQRPSKLQRRHTIMVCESPIDGKVAQELPPLAEEEDEPSPIKESHSLASLHSGLRPNPSHIQQQQQPYHHPSFPKTSFSDHDIQNQVTLRNPQGLKRRSSMDHRRSLTSLPTGLCAIPEMEDSGGAGADNCPSSQKPSPLERRSWSSEQAPPPNPSPPIKARVRAGVGMSMSGSRLSRSSSLPSTQSPFQQLTTETGHLHLSKPANSMQAGTSNNNRTHPASSIASHVPPSSLELPSSSSSSSMRNLESNNNKHASNSLSSTSSSPSSSSSPVTAVSKTKNPLSPTRAKHLSVASIFVAAPRSSNSSPPTSPSTPPPLPSQPAEGGNKPILSLDSSTSSQSPAYRKHPTRKLQQSHMVIEPTPQRQTRWHHSNTQEERQTQRPSAVEQSPSTNSTITTSQTHYQGDVQDEQAHHHISSDSLPSRRLSLDGGVSRYLEKSARWREGMKTKDIEETTTTNSAAPPPVPSRRLSLGTGGQASEMSEKTKSQEDLERISRWRMLQHDDLENRVKKERTSTSQPGVAPVIRSPSSGSFDRRGREIGNEDGSKSFATRYQQLKQQYQSEQQKDLQHQNSESDTKAQQQITSSNANHQSTQRQQQQKQSLFKTQHHKSRISNSGRRLLYESPEALQQQMATEEARLTRWRQLEEGREGDDVNEDSTIIPPPSPFLDLSESDLEYVSDNGYGNSRGMNLSNTTIVEDGTIPTTPVDDNTTTTSTTIAPNSSIGKFDGSLHAMPKRWENPVECLSLTLEEVTHIRSVLTKAELESLISHPDLYQMVSKSKLCFTCKTTRFSLFGEWGTKCKFCKRTVCSKCLRKMNVPADHFRNIPVYTLSPTPFSQEVLEFIQNFVKKVPNTFTSTTQKKLPLPLPIPLSSQSSSSKSITRSNQRQQQQLNTNSSISTDSPATSNPIPDNAKVAAHDPPTTTTPTPKPLQRSQSVLVPGQKSQTVNKGSMTRTPLVKGPLMAICCDCKGMIMEIIRASKASLALISSSSSSSTQSSSINLLPPTMEATSSSSTSSSPPSQRQQPSPIVSKKTVLSSAHSFRY